MTVDLLSIINIEGTVLKVNDTIDFGDKGEFDVKFVAPAEVEATFSSLGGEVNLKGRVNCSVEYTCDRCAKAYPDTLSIEFEEVLKKETPFENEENTDNDIIFFKGNSVDLDEIVYKNIFMNIPTKKLCKADCKGLCAKCGKDLNKGDCSCDTRETDPRFDVLDNFFK
ncbi:MAG: DUF177 domain-containing protein [Clostridia bacterium]|nr:DUF177 domain-containing protein [Clostridia bacterium]